MTSLNHILARWLDDRPAPAVDCAACARPLKCCDFQPFVPNFLVGAARAAGVHRPRPAWQFGALPLGLIPTGRFRATRGAHACAFYTGERCGVWTWRPAECSAYSCVREDPAFAARAFAFETTLAQMALVELGFDDAFVGSQIDILNDPGEDVGFASDVDDVYDRAWSWVRGLSRADIAAWLEDL